MKHTCTGCGKEFENKIKNRKFCSMDCRKTSTKETITCAFCKKVFQAQRSSHKKYCSISCGLSARNLTDQNPAYHRDISGNKNPMYGKGLRGVANGMFGVIKEFNKNWKGGRKVRKDGYILVVAPEGHPYPADERGQTWYILEHRLVMEKHLGRFLNPKEVVHHIDGNPSNNNINNLRLYGSQADHIKEAHSKH